MWFTPPSVNINNIQLNAVEHFIYLGRLAKANSSFSHLLKCVWQNKYLRLTTKIQVYRAVVVSTLIYGSGSWVL